MRKPSIYSTNPLAYNNVIDQLKKIHDASKDDLEKKLIENAIVHTLRKKSEYEKPKYISIALYNNLTPKKAEITKHGDIHRINKTIVKVILDHCNPVTESVKKFLQKTSKMNVIQLIDNNFTCAILKTEDQLLNSSKYKTLRKNNWEQVYKDCEIGYKPY